MYEKGVFRGLLILVLLMILFRSTSVLGQIRAGASFLKIGHGVRISSMGLTSGGELRDNYAIFTNPGAAGFLREWQWSVSYNKWIADVYQASFLFNKRIRMPWSNQTRFSVAAIYQGVPEFDSSDDASPTATASDLLLSLSIGQPLSFLSNNLSFGANVKYLKSKLDNFSASSVIFDLGFLARTPKFSLKNSWLKYGIFSAGASLTQNGNDLKFDQINTPLPQTGRVGISFYAGSHDGFQIQLSGDYFSIKDETGHYGLAAAINFSNLFSLNLGYNFNNDLMDKFSIGGTFQLDDFAVPRKAIFPGKNKAARLEIATLNEGEFFSRSYQGGAHYFPNCPEAFQRKQPGMDDTIKVEFVNFSWEKTRDPDIFDSVTYSVIVSRSENYLQDLIALGKKSSDEFLNRLGEEDSLILLAKNDLVDTRFEIPTPEAGHYYWTVMALDENFHIRISNNGGKEIGHFYVPATDVEIKDIKFKYSPWITRDDYQGILEITLHNNGSVPARDFMLTCQDSVVSLVHKLPADSVVEKTRKILAKEIDILPANSSKIIQIPWHTPLLGKHEIVAIADKNNLLNEKRRENNKISRSFFTIPKGMVSLPDTVNSLSECRTRLAMPLITRIFFDANDASVHDEYLFANGSDPYLAILSQRLIEHPDMIISLQGVADPNSEKATKSLANQRARAVKDSLVRLGVEPAQIKLLGGKVLPHRRVPANKDDARMVFEDRRYVEIFTKEKNQSVLFEPIEHEIVEYSTAPLPAEISILMAVPIIEGEIRLASNGFADSMEIIPDGGKLAIQEKSKWQLSDQAIKSLINKSANYDFILADVEGRKFRTRQSSIHFTRSKIERHHRIVMPMKFAETAPIYSFYWNFCFNEIEKAMKQSGWRFRFSGHGCAIGSEAVNLRLSRQRVKNFDKKFRQFLKKSLPEAGSLFLKRLDKPKGYGEKKPLIFNYTSGETQLFGDNNKPSGRILNRRIELELYRVDLK